jgi:hypothetical protein
LLDDDEVDDVIILHINLDELDDDAIELIDN